MSPATVLPDLSASFTWASGTGRRATTTSSFTGRYPRAPRWRARSTCRQPTCWNGRSETLSRAAPCRDLDAGRTGRSLGARAHAGRREVRLDELVNAWAALLRVVLGGGVCLRAVRDGTGKVTRRPDHSPEAPSLLGRGAAQVVDILADPRRGPRLRSVERAAAARSPRQSRPERARGFVTTGASAAHPRWWSACGPARSTARRWVTSPA